MDSDVINLRDLVAVLRRRWRAIVLCVVVAVAIALAAATLSHPTYSATAEVLVGPIGSSDAASGQEVMAPEEVATQVQVVTSQPVAADAKRALATPASVDELLDSVTVEAVENTRVLAISAVRASAQDAADVADAFAAAYLRDRQAEVSQQGTVALQALRTRYNDLLGQMQSVQRQQQGLAAASARLAVLQAQESALTVQMRTVLRRMAVADTVDAGSQSAGEVLVAATEPAAPNQRYLVPAGLALGLLFGVGLAFVRDHFDDTVHDEARLSAALDRPVLARVPHWPEVGEGGLATMQAPDGPAAEAYRALASALRYPSSGSPGGGDPAGHEHRVLLVTSPGLGQGRTTVASNLAVAAARYGLTVIAVDADLRNPGLAKRFGLNALRGFSELLAGEGELDSHLLAVDGVENLRILPSDAVPPNPAELLASAAAEKIIGTLRSRADLVVVDSSPVDPVVDARELLPHVDDVVLVVRHGVTRVRAAAEALEQIIRVGGTVSGVVVNDTRPPRARQGYQYRHPLEIARRMLARVESSAATASRRATDTGAALSRSRGSGGRPAR